MLQEARTRGIALDGNFARKHRLLICAAASEGYINTREYSPTGAPCWGNHWRITSAGVIHLEHYGEGKQA